MKPLIRLLTKVALAAATSLPMASANAGLIVNFYSGTNLFAQMTTTGGTSFSLDFVGTGVSSGGFINELFMDGPAGTFTNTTAAAVTTPSETYALNSFNGGGGGGNIYDWKIDFPQSNDSSRFAIGETATWTIVVTDPNDWDLNKIHINAFNAAGDSIKLDGCIDGTAGCGGGTIIEVPEPASLGLVGLALLGLGFASRRKQQ